MRQKRLTFWPKKEHEEAAGQEANDEQRSEEQASEEQTSEGQRSEENKDEFRSEEDQIDEYNDYDNVNLYHKDKDYDDEDESKFLDDFSTDPEFSDLDLDFENLSSSKEDVDYHDPKTIQRRKDEQLDGYIREYVAQLNKDPVKASGPIDLSYYEKIAEQTVEKEDMANLTDDDEPCIGNVRV